MSLGHDDRHSGPYALVVVDPLPRELVERGLCAADGVWPSSLWDASVADESKRERLERRELAALVCSQCPVRQACAAYADENRQCGVWGGKLFRRSGEPKDLLSAPYR